MEKLEPKQFKQVWSKVMDLTMNPRPHYSEHLSGQPNCFRIALGEFRCVYKILSQEIHVLAVDRRNDGEIYRKLDRIN